MCATIVLIMVKLEFTVTPLINDPTHTSTCTLISNLVIFVSFGMVL